MRRSLARNQELAVAGTGLSCCGGGGGIVQVRIAVRQNFLCLGFGELISGSVTGFQAGFPAGLHRFVGFLQKPRQIATALRP